MNGGGRDPRWRPFRVATLTVYLIISVGFSFLVIYSVFKSVFEMTPGGVQSGPEVYTQLQCARGAEAMLEELEAQRRAYAAPEAAVADHRFLEFRIDWLTRLRRLQGGCGLERQERADLRRSLGALDRLVDLYTTESVQFASSIGIELDRVRDLIEESKQAAQRAGSRTE
jgi:hypothetical protein